MGTNDIKAFAAAGGANVLTQAEYLALAALSTGFTSGKANSKDVNKALRQATLVAAAMAQFVADKGAVDVLDDGNVAGLATKILSAINNTSQPKDATLTALSGLEGASNKLPYFDGVDTAALTDITAFARILLAKSSADGVLNELGLGEGTGRLLASRVITASGTYTPTPGTKYIIAELIGGGGGGGGAPTTGSSQTAPGGGGGGGGYCCKVINSGFSGQQITIGAGGLGATGGAASGDPGGNTTFMGMVAGGGGGGGPGNPVTVAAQAGIGGNPGGGSGGDVNAAGDSGGGGVMYSTTYCSSGGGGGNKLFPFDYGAPRITNNNGLPGNAYGCGGGGGNNGISQSTTRLGGTGSRGLAIIWEYA